MQLLLFESESKCGSPSNKLCKYYTSRWVTVCLIIHTVMYLVNSLRLQTATKLVILLFLTKLLCSWQFSKFLKVVNSYNIDLFHNGGQIKYSFVLMLISLTSLITTSKFQKNICFKTRAVGVINIKTKKCKSGCHLWKWPIVFHELTLC